MQMPSDLEQRAVGMAHDVAAVLAHEVVRLPVERRAHMGADVRVGEDAGSVAHHEDLELFVTAQREDRALGGRSEIPLSPSCASFSLFDRQHRTRRLKTRSFPGRSRLWMQG
jgi:UDP-N-acetylmuramoylalanine-D-glutamate ligase